MAALLRIEKQYNSNIYIFHPPITNKHSKRNVFLKIPNSLIYLSGPLLNAGVSFVALSIFTQFLSPEDFGYFTIFKIYSQIATIIIIFNSFQLLLQKNYTNSSSLGGFHITLFLFSSLVAIFLVGLSWLAKDWIAYLIQIPSEWVLPFTFYGWINFCQLLWMNTQQAREKAWSFVLLQSLSALTAIGVSLYLVVEIGFDWTGRFYGALAASLLLISLFLILSLFTRKFSWGKPSFTQAREIFQFGFPLFPQALGAWVVSSIDRIYLTHMVGIAVTGIYSLAFAVANVFIMLITAVNRSFMPKLFAQLSLGTQESQELAVKNILKVDLFYLLAAFLGCLITPFFFSNFIHLKFYGATDFLYWLLPAYALYGITQNHLNIIIFSKKTKAASWSTDSLAAVINIALCPLMIYFFGAVGAAQSTFVCYLIAAFTSWYAANRVLPLPWLSALKVS